MAKVESGTRRAADIVRLLKLLGKREMQLAPCGNGEKFEIIDPLRETNRRYRFADADISWVLKRGLVRRGASDTISLTQDGVSWLRRTLAGDDGFQDQHRSLKTKKSIDGRRVTENERESPLVWLRKRRDKNGAPLIDDQQFSAGERLRAEFDRAQLMPRTSSNWSAAINQKAKRGASANGLADAMDAALAARDRINNALRAVGSDLSGVLVDVCCFLKGLEAVERERQWPPRSAKIVLTIALNRLADHYGLNTPAKPSQRSGQMRHWATEDFKPHI